jgi:hypothetical protein
MDRRIRRVILVIAADAVVGALLGLLIELAGDQPRFPAAGELPADAIRRIRPPVIFLDCDHDAACEDLAYHAADAVSAQVVLFAHVGSRERLQKMATERDTHTLALPVASDELTALVDRVLTA